MKKNMWLFLFFLKSLHAAMTWSSPVTLSDSSITSLGPNLAFDPYRNAVVGWTATNGSSFFSQVAGISPGGNWSSPENLSTWPSSGSIGFLVAFDSSGNATAIWPEPDGLYTATKPFGGSWTSASQIVSANIITPSLAVDSSGTATAAWINTGDHRVYISTRTSGTWSTATPISTDGDTASIPQVAAANSSGNFYAVWLQNDGSNTIVQAAKKPSGDAWLSATPISQAGQNAFTPSLAIDLDETVTAIWTRSDGTNTIVQSSTLVFGGVWPVSGTNLSASGQNAVAPQIAVNASGVTYAIWSRSNGTNTIIQAKQKTALKGWDSTASDLSLSGQNATVPQIAIDPFGNVVASWLRSDGSHNRAQAIAKFSNLPWGSVSTLSASGQNALTPKIAIDIAANAIIVWSYLSGSNFVIQASQGTPPTTYVNASIGNIPTVTWGETINLSQAGSNAFFRSAVADSLGNVLVGWQNLINGDHTIQVTTASSTSNWALSTDISTPGTDALSGIFGYDASGNATAIFTQNMGSGPFYLYSAQKLVGENWQPATQVSSLEVGEHALTVDSTNRATAIWVQNEGLNRRLYASTRSSGTWSIPEAISDPGEQIFAPQLTVDSSGNVYAIWVRESGDAYRVQSARKAAGGGWGASSNLSDSAEDSNNPQITVDPSGNVYAVWEIFDGSNQIIQNAIYSSGSWSSASDLSASDFDSANPQITSDSSGNILAIWQRAGDSSVYIESALYPVGASNWQEATPKLELAANAAYPRMAFDSNGNLFVIWQLTNGTTQHVIQTAENWGAPITLSSRGAGVDSQARLVVDSLNNIYAFWNSYDGSNFIVQSASTRSSQPEPPVPAPIASGSVVQKVANFGVYQERYNYLSWTAGSASDTVAYYVFRNGILIAVLNSSQLFYEDHNQAKQETVTYRITAVNSEGQQGTAITLIWSGS